MTDRNHLLTGGFSFLWLLIALVVTMSTLGFGDITPRTPLAQTMTWMQAVFGQLYLVILIARLVSLLPQTDAD